MLEKGLHGWWKQKKHSVDLGMVTPTGFNAAKEYYEN
jgi:hypothetical protein